MNIGDLNVSREIKSKRVQLLMKPTVYDRLVCESNKHDISVNECVERIVKLYFMEQVGSRTPKHRGSI